MCLKFEGSLQVQTNLNQNRWLVSREPSREVTAGKEKASKSDALPILSLQAYSIRSKIS